ncbi:hypothetical protein CDCA_CDCA10G2861 [Cyanidium caldarium]|uniref:LIM zinc-binding domain-containing protein n=1 Tax=Cyanidium caldarium TaxID=2771 RepID=A0AAV9IXJ0_CYACA|nr:hypothetical protein CDCA_CDCA10G2861 [Cyanidium caldarium]
MTMYGGSDETCSICGKLVYAAERVSTDGRIYHNNCFRCRTCNKKLALGTYAQIDGVLFCKPHFDAQFNAAGRYEVFTAAPAQPAYGNLENVARLGNVSQSGVRKTLDGMNAGTMEPLRAYIEYLIDRIGEQQQHMDELRMAMEQLRDGLSAAP